MWYNVYVTDKKEITTMARRRKQKFTELLVVDLFLTILALIFGTIYYLTKVIC